MVIRNHTSVTNTHGVGYQYLAYRERRLTLASGGCHFFFFTSPESPIQRDWTRVGKSHPKALIIFSIQSNCSFRLALPFHHFSCSSSFLASRLEYVRGCALIPHFFYGHAVSLRPIPEPSRCSVRDRSPTDSRERSVHVQPVSYTEHLVRHLELAMMRERK